MAEGRATGYVSTRLAQANRDLDPGRVLADIARNIGPHLPDDLDAPVLDVGPGLGHTLDFLRMSGYRRYEGVDVDEEAVEALRGRHPVHLVRDPAAYVRERPEQYGAVILRDVVAHIAREEVADLVRSAHRGLRPGGRLVVQTFNAALTTAHYTFANDLTHRVPYTEHSLRQLLLLGGFERVEVLPAAIVTRSRAGWAFRAVRAAYCRALGLRYGLERGFGGNPTIYSRALIGVGRR